MDNETYTVKEGDTLNGIAKSRGFSNYKEANISGYKSGNPDLIMPGEVLSFGPKKENKLIETSSTARTKFIKNSSALDSAIGALSGGNTVPGQTPETPAPAVGYDPMLANFDKMSANSDALTKSLIASTQALYQNRRNQVTSQYEDYKRGLQAMGIDSNMAQATPELLAGHIQKATNDQMAKLSEYDAEEQKTLLEAKVAKDNNDFRVLQEKMDYLKALKAERVNAVKEMYDTLNATDKIADIQAKDIYDTLETLEAADKEAFLIAVADKYNLPLMSLVSAVNEEKRTRQKDDLARRNTESTIANRGGGSGGSTSTTATKNALIKNIDKVFSSKTKDASGYSVLGEDGYIDPQAYIEAHQTWIDKGLGSKQFLTQYPVKNYVNPKSYKNLPASLRPATTSTTSSRSS